MPEIDDFASLLLEEAKRFYERANESIDSIAKGAYLHASLMVGFCAFEAHINSVADEVAERDGMSIHDISILREREVKLENGEYTILVDRLKMYRLEDRILYLHRLATG